LVVISADFSHYLPFQKAIESENKAAKSLMYRLSNPKFTSVVDDIVSFNYLYQNVSSSTMLQWVGRTRSPGDKAVGYLSFLIRKSPRIIDKFNSNGFFVTVYDEELNIRECLGKWYSKYSEKNTNSFIQSTLESAKTKNRFTVNEQYLDSPLKYYTITWLFKSKSKKFIRGWNSIQSNSFFLSDVFLENTYENGKWIQNKDIQWDYSNVHSNDSDFDLTETFSKLQRKAGKIKTKRKNHNYQLYYSMVEHITLS